jgi:hypothetical protein
VLAGTGDTETARYNTSVKYQVAVGNFRVGAVGQFGGYDLGNGSDGAYQFDVGADYAGFSVDAIYSYAKDAVSLATFNGIQAAPLTQDDLEATLADISAVALAGKYTNGPWKAFAGYEYARYSNPTDSYAANAAEYGFTSLGGYDVPGNKVYAGDVNITAYTVNKDLQVAWGGVKYAIRSDLDIAAAYYWEGQNDYYVPSGGHTCSSASPTGVGAYKSSCAGTTQAVSGLIDWRPLKRLDLYAGVMYSQVRGGMASGYMHANNYDPTVGLRLSF